MKRISQHWIIHGFALLHAATTILCYSLGIGDTLFLTTWTVILTVLLCMREKISLEISVTLVILVNIFGWLIGVAVAAPLGSLIPDPGYAHALSTFLTTEILGWLLLLFFYLFPSIARQDTEAISYGQIKWVTIAAGGILVVRLALNLLSRTSVFNGVSATSLITIFLSQTGLLLLMLGVTILYILYARQDKGWRGNWIQHVSAFVGICLFAAFIAGLSSTDRLHTDLNWIHFLELLILAAIVEAAIFSIVFLTIYATAASRRMEAERGRANLAQREYRQLKQQVNPHFLFNSLNILDCLIADGKKEEARDYVHKLSSLYRYMLRSENEPVVALSEELEYVRMYVELLKVRFPVGLEVEMDIREEDQARFIIKYAIQLLVENAQKHNIISKDVPLHIRISSDGERVTVANNLNLRLTQPESTGVGLKHIRQNYRERSGKDILIRETDTEYIVELPLL